MNIYDILEEELNTLKKEYTALTISISRDELFADQIKRHQLQGRIAGFEKALATVKTVKTYDDGYSDGVADTLSELSEVYGEGIEETDLWAEHMTAGEGTN